MIRTSVFASTAIASVFLLTGCSATKPLEYYSMPDPLQPSALLRINSVSNYGWSIERMEADCDQNGDAHNLKVTYLADYAPQQRYSNRRPTPSAVQEVSLPAGFASFFTYYSIGDKTCHMNFDSFLMPGKKYEMVLNIIKRGVFESDQCVPSITDLDTKEPAPLMSNKSGKFLMTASCKRRNLMKNLERPAVVPPSQ